MHRDSLHISLFCMRGNSQLVKYIIIIPKCIVYLNEKEMSIQWMEYNEHWSRCCCYFSLKSISFIHLFALSIELICIRAGFRYFFSFSLFFLFSLSKIVQNKILRFFKYALMLVKSNETLTKQNSLDSTMNDERHELYQHP